MFSDEAREALEAEGYKIYLLTGQSIRSLREGGKKFWSTWHRDYPEFEGKTSRLSEVAINPDPDRFFLPNSNNKTLEQQLRMVEKFSKQLRGRERLSGVEAVVGEAPDYAELAFAYLKATGQYLFGESYDSRYTRTVTPTVGSDVALVGYFDAPDGLDVYYWYCDRGSDSVWVAPLVVPA